MSLDALKWACTVHVGDADEKHTLIAVANHHNAKTGECFPGQETLAAETERSVDTIQRHLKSLAAKGLVNRHRRYRDGYRTSDGYTLAINGKLKPQGRGVSDSELKPQACGVSPEELKPQSCGVSSDGLTPQNEKLTPQNPDLTPQNTPTLDRTAAAYKDEREEQGAIEREALEPATANAPARALVPNDVIIPEAVDPFETEFEEQFWPIYPNKIAKTKAMPAFVKKRKDGVALDVIMAGLHRYVNKNDYREWCNPTTWINQARWEDKPAPRSRGNVVEAADQIVAAFAGGAQLPERPF
jgi:hypothetical protein